MLLARNSSESLVHDRTRPGGRPSTAIVSPVHQARSVGACAARAWGSSRARVCLNQHYVHPRTNSQQLARSHTHTLGRRARARAHTHEAGESSGMTAPGCRTTTRYETGAAKRRRRSGLPPASPSQTQEYHEQNVFSDTLAKAIKALRNNFCTKVFQPPLIATAPTSLHRPPPNQAAPPCRARAHRPLPLIPAPPARSRTHNPPATHSRHKIGRAHV